MRIKRPIIVLLIIISTLVSYIGPGVNIIYYCSNYCHSQGISSILEDSCCNHKGIDHKAQHHKSHYEDSLGYDFMERDFQDCESCSLMRIHFDWTVVNSSLHLHIPSFDLDLFDSFLSLPLIVQDNLIFSLKRLNRDFSPQKTPRQYLRRLVLLII